MIALYDIRAEDSTGLNQPVRAVVASGSKGDATIRACRRLSNTMRGEWTVQSVEMLSNTDVDFWNRVLGKQIYVANERPQDSSYNNRSYEYFRLV